MTPPEETSELQKNSLVLKDGIIQVWDGTKYTDLVKTLSTTVAEHTEEQL